MARKKLEPLLGFDPSVGRAAAVGKAATTVNPTMPLDSVESWKLVWTAADGSECKLTVKPGWTLQFDEQRTLFIELRDGLIALGREDAVLSAIGPVAEVVQ